MRDVLDSAARRGLSHPAAALLLVTLAAFGCSVSPTDEVDSAEAELPSVATAAQQTEPAQPQPGVQPSRIDPTTSNPGTVITAPTTQKTPVTTAADAPTTTQPEQPDDDTGQANEESQPADGGTEGSKSTENLDSPDTRTDDPDAASVREETGEHYIPTGWTTHNPYRFDAKYDYGDGQIIAPWLVPWKDGFLQVGQPMTDEEYLDKTRFVVRFSADGFEWTDFDALDVPRGHLDQSPITRRDDDQFDPHHYVPAVQVASNGEHLVVAVPWPRLDSAWSGHGSDDSIDGPTPHPRSTSLSLKTSRTGTRVRS